MIDLSSNQVKIFISNKIISRIFDKIYSYKLKRTFSSIIPYYGEENRATPTIQLSTFKTRDRIHVA